MTTWAAFEDFYGDFCLGYWSPAVVRLPVGDFWVGLAPDVSLLRRGNVRDVSFAQLTGALADVARLFGVARYGVYLSDTWVGDVAGMKDFLVKEGWLQNVPMVHLERALTDDEAWLPDPVIVSCTDADALAALHEAATQSGLAQLVVRPLRDGFVAGCGVDGAPVRHQFVVAKGADGTLVAMGVGSWRGALGYLHCLAVRREHRNQGWAKRLVAAQLAWLQRQGVRTVVTSVAEDNAASMTVQQRAGFEAFAKTEFWQPPRRAPGAGVGAGA
jgi:ribosomal protein S18 acetylase RimI-like enzyme